MNIISMVGYQNFQRLHPLWIFDQLGGLQANGCLKVMNGPIFWLLYLHREHLTVGLNSVNSFRWLEWYLFQLSYRILRLFNIIHTQVCVLVQGTSDRGLLVSSDYHVIAWPVAQKHFNHKPTSIVIDGLAQEVIEPFLLTTEGHDEFIDQTYIPAFPKLCQIGLQSLVNYCQTYLEQNISQLSLQSTNVLPSAQIQIELSDKSLGDDPRQIDTRLELEITQNLINASLPLPHLSTHRRYTIACIHNNQTVLQAVQSFLSAETFSVVIINDPFKALLHLVRHKPDLLLLDIALPHLDSYELCTMLRRHPNFKQTPIILITEHTGLVERAKAKLVGASSHLTKPFTRTELLKAIFQFLT
jgi:twitching motility two-component system response regulator PilG